MERPPSNLADFINWANLHGPLFQTNQAGLGLGVTQAANFKSACKAASDLYAAQINALELARVATVKQKDAVMSARRQAADCIRTISGFAGTQTNPNDIYNLAQIPAPQPPSPQPPPGTPTDFTASLGNDGAVTIKWKAKNAGSAGATVWTVKRQLGGVGAFSFIGASGRRTFTDKTIPAGVTNVQYTIQGQRGDAVGDASLPFTVQFGNNGDGVTIAAQFTTPTAPAKLAA